MLRHAAPPGGRVRMRLRLTPPPPPHTLTHPPPACRSLCWRGAKTSPCRAPTAAASRPPCWPPPRSPCCPTAPSPRPPSRRTGACVYAQASHGRRRWSDRVPCPPPSPCPLRTPACSVVFQPGNGLETAGTEDPRVQASGMGRGGGACGSCAAPSRVRRRRWSRRPAVTTCGEGQRCLRAQPAKHAIAQPPPFPTPRQVHGVESQHASSRAGYRHRPHLPQWMGEARAG
jgi:hypothetical protein